MKLILITLFFMFFPIIYFISMEYKTHKVQKGETLWRISKKYGISIQQLCKINKIEDVTKVISGAKIKVPIENEGTENTSYSKGEYRIHYLKKNETLWRVSKKYGISVQELCKINKISDVTRVKYGAKIKIPLILEYLDYKLPASGEINLFTTSHFKGIYIFTGKNKIKRSVYAIEAGRVNYVENVPGYGTTIFIKHNNGYISTYSGFEEIYVKKGDNINLNQIIGLAGNLSRFNKHGILFSIQYKGIGLKFDIKKQKFIKNPI